MAATRPQATGKAWWAALLMPLLAPGALGACATATAPANLRPTAAEANDAAAERAQIERLKAERAQQRRLRAAATRPAPAGLPADATPAAQVEPAPPPSSP